MTPLPDPHGRAPRAAFILAALLAMLVLAAPAQAGAREERSPFRTIITSDAEADDIASFHRLLLHMNELSSSVEAIIYSSSTFHWAGDPDANPPIPENNWAGVDVFPGIINGTGEKYGAGGGYRAVVENLRRHDSRYPSVEHMNSLIKVGNITYRGEYQQDTEGSEFIKQALLDRDPRPIFIGVWGGTNTVAAALRSIEQQYKGTRRWPRIYERVTAKARVNIILDQDETYKDYIDPNWPDLNVNLNRDQFWSVAYFLFRYQDGDGPRRVPDELELYFKPDFMKLIKFGALLSSYPVLADFADLGLPDIDEFLSEGDSPSYFELLDNGLRSWEDPTWGGWGGRSVKVRQHRWSDWPTYVLDPDLKYDTPRDQVDYDDPSRARDESPYPRQYDASYPQTRWIPALQRELAARAEWQTKSYEDANHPPLVGVAGGRLDIDVRRGQRVALNGTVEDPDGDEVTTTWWQYREAGSYPGIADIARPSALNTSFVVPDDARPGQTIHMILKVRDRAEKSFTRYQRIVATVKKSGHRHRGSAR